MYTILAPREFWHAADLAQRHSSLDPRDGFPDSEGVEIDLRKCGFVRPQAVAWCAVFSLLVRQHGYQARVLVPEDFRVGNHLKAIELYKALTASGVDVDPRGLQRSSDRKIVLPLSMFTSEGQVDELSNRVLENLMTKGLSSSNLSSFVTETFAELAMNAVQHSESPIGALGLVQFYGFGPTGRFVCVVADGGIGIRKSMERNPELKTRVPYDWVAIDLATRERISGTGDPHRGIGLYQVAEDFRKAGRQLVIHSGIGMLKIEKDAQTQAQRVPLFPGTLGFASIPV